jgi:hypothetical protein
LIDLVQDKMVDPDRVARLAGVEGGEGAAGKDDEKVRCLKWVAELEQDD